ncbi:MAG: hypothetical protein AB3N14_06630 [Flavobacteriaceae bacterium]
MELIIPEAHKTLFTEGIKHPDLYLWDAWSYHQAGVIHLYCLAVNRQKNDGTTLHPSERNNYPFHVRHFSSKDEGLSWRDEGCFLKARRGEGRHDSKTIWSGSIEVLQDGSKLTAYTGLSEVSEERTFLQNIALGISKDGFTVDKLAEEPLSSPLRDWEEIKSMGYYLDDPDLLGHNDGEKNGPIMAWRDPFIFIDLNQRIHLFWAAKIDSHKNAMAHALLEESEDLYKIATLFPPISLPDGANFTQLELPKIHYDPDKQLYYLIVSSCNRLYEMQSDDEVDKNVRLYRSSNLEGPWEAFGIHGSSVLQKENLFGLTVLKTDFPNERLLCIAPYTDAASDELSLTFTKAFYIHLNPVRLEF